MTEHHTEHQSGSDPVLDRRLRDLGDRADHVAWVDSADVRRRGEHRRRVVTSTMAIAAAAVVGIGAVVATQVVDRPSAAPPATTTPSGTEPTKLADDPFLQPADLGVIGPYESFTRVETPDGEALPCVRDTAAEWEAMSMQTQYFATDLDATFHQTVLQYENGAGASRGAVVAAGPNGCASLLPGYEFDQRQEWLPLGGGAYRRSISGSQWGSEDGGLAYSETAVLREGTVVIILTWSSLGSPFEDPDAWVWDDARLTSALDRALADAS